MQCKTCAPQCESCNTFVDERGDDLITKDSGCESDKTCSGYNEVCCKRPTTSQTETTKKEAPSNWIETPVDSSVRSDVLAADIDADSVSNSSLFI